MRNKHLYSIKIDFVKEDTWIGVYRKKQNGFRHFYICIIPCFPVHLIIM